MMQTQATPKALAGIRILDLTRVYAGPYCSTLLGDMGAEIIKIEPPGGEVMRDNPPQVEKGKGGPHTASRSGYFLGLNRNKYGITLNLKHPKALKMFKDLVKISDVVLENYRPGVMERLGIGYPVLKEINPRIILGSISGFGQDGPYANRMGFDTIAQAMSGFISLTGHPGGPLTKAGTSLADANAGVHAAFGIMCALWYREQTGVGQYVDVSMQEAMVSILENAIVKWTIGGVIQTPIGTMNPNDAPWGAYQCKDGYIMICTLGNEHWVRFCEALNKPEWAEDPEFATKEQRWEKKYILLERIEEVTKNYTIEEVGKMMDDHRIANSHILNIREVVEDPHLNARGYFVEVEHPVIGKAIIPGMPFKMSETPGTVDRPSPLVGEHDQLILGKYLNLSADDIEKLHEEGAM